MRARSLITLSWLLWSSGYYLYYPFYSLLAERVIGENRLGELFFITSLINVLLPLAGVAFGERLGVRLAITLSMVLSGVGVALMPMSNSFALLYFYSVLSFAFFLGLPSYYSVMSSLGEGTISLVWAISILPSLVFPALGGALITYLGFTADFLVAGILVVVSGLVNLSLKANPLKGKAGKPSLIPMAVIVPIAVIAPYFTPILKSMGLSYEEIGLLVSASEVLGMFLTLYLRKLGYLGLPLSMLVFSLVGLVSFNPWLGVNYGAWEAIIPLSLDYAVNDKSVRGYGVVISSQQVGWLLGYAIDAVIDRPNYLLIISSIASIILALVLAVLTRRARRGQRAS